MDTSCPGDTDKRPLTDHARKNRDSWEAISDWYEGRHAASLEGANARAWGLWRIPEDELHILGDVADKDVLEFGCGAARWSIALAHHGACPVGLDISPTQLAHARRLLSAVAISFTLIQ